MVVTCVHIEVKEDCIEAFKEATLKNHFGTREENGNFRFDVLQEEDNPCKFVLYEVFESLEAIDKHKEQSHYLNWREAVEPFMAIRRKGIRYKIIEPQSPDSW